MFSHGRLYDAAREAGLSGRAQEVFGRLGTNNFEGVLRLLDDTKWVGRLYGLSEDGLKAVEDDLRVVKETLVSAVAKSHLDHAGLVSDAKKAAALAYPSASLSSGAGWPGWPPPTTWRAPGTFTEHCTCISPAAS